MDGDVSGTRWRLLWSRGRGGALGGRQGPLLLALPLLIMGLLLPLAVATPIGGDDGGTGSFSREVGAGSGSAYDNLWYVHMSFMVTGVVLAIATILFILLKKRMKKSWYKAHWVTGIVSIILLLAGFSIAFHMIASTSGLKHFGVTHSRVGIVTLTITVVGLVLGLVYLAVKSAKKRVRSPHIWISWACIALLLLTVALGLFQVLYTYPGYWK
jgi:multisubunit Na+/H+ antiporter MnhB subunit